MRKIKRFFFFVFNDPREILLWVMSRNWLHLSDELYIKIWYRLKTGMKLHLDNPQNYNEKLQWLKLYDHNPLYTIMVDKYAVKNYVTKQIGPQYIIPLVGVWDKPQDINFDSLPNQFVLKTTHGGGGGGVVVCKDKTNFDIKKAIEILSDSMRSDGSILNKEWPYKNVPRRVIAETYMEDLKYNELRDYKFFCFNGEPKIMFIASGRMSNPEPYFDFFDMEFNHLNIKSAHPCSPKGELPGKPESFDEMKEIAAKLSEGLPHVRIDLYEVNGHVYFGEYTFFHWGGCGSFEPEEWLTIMGDWIKLPEEKRI